MPIRRICYEAIKKMVLNGLNTIVTHYLKNNLKEKIEGINESQRDCWLFAILGGENGTH